MIDMTHVIEIEVYLLNLFVVLGHQQPEEVW